MTNEYERGRAAGLAEAVKVVRDYQDISNDGSWSVEKRKPNDMRGLALAFEIEALSTSPDHVLVPREPTREMITAAQFAVPGELDMKGHQERQMIAAIYRAMIAEVK